VFAYTLAASSSLASHPYTLAASSSLALPPLPDCVRPRAKGLEGFLTESRRAKMKLLTEGYVAKYKSTK
jgi:hypothetical protein